MAEALSSFPKSPDSAIGTLVDNSPEEEVEDLSAIPSVPKISESCCLDDVSFNYKEEKSASLNKSNSLHSEDPLDKVVGKDDDVSAIQENQNHADEAVYHNLSEKDSNFYVYSSDGDKTLISDINLDLENQDNVNNSQPKTCDKLLLDTEELKVSKSKKDDFGMIDIEQAIVLNDLRDEDSQDLNTATISTDCPSYSATLQVNDEGEVEETLLNAEHTSNLVEIQNSPKSKVFSNATACLNTDSSLSDFLLSCDANENERSGNEEVNKLTSKNVAKWNFSPVVLSCSPSSLKVNLSIPEDLSEYSNCSDENISLIESEVESTEETESEMVLSASMQFSLNKSSNNDSQDLAFVEDDVLAANTIPVEFNHHKKQIITEDASEADCISDIEEDPLEIDEGNLRICATNHISEPLELPETVTKLTNEAGSEVYVVGTAHFSKESQGDVSRTIQMVRPDIIVLELCKARTAVLELDEETILKESKSLDFGKIRIILNQHGKVQGVLYILLLSVSAHITEQLKMAPGGEFREAIHEARRTVPGCMIQLGDRPIQVTLSRALASLSVWQKAKLIWHILASKEPISKEEVEKCKKKDFIEELLAEMTGQFPGICEVFVKERDIFLTRSLQLAADPSLYQNYNRTRTAANKSPRVVVGVVGIGHIAGIVELWDKVTEEDVNAVLVIPPPNLSDRIFKVTVKCAFYGLIGFGIYKCLRPTAKDSIRTFFGNNGTKITDYFSKFIR